MSTIFTSTFSPGMVAADARKRGAVVTVDEISLETAKQFAASDSCKSAVGHPSTAKLMTKLLEREIPFERVALALETPLNEAEDRAERSDRFAQNVIVFQLDQALFKRLNEGEILDEAALDAANAAGALSWLLVRVTSRAVVNDRADNWVI